MNDDGWNWPPVLIQTHAAGQRLWTVTKNGLRRYAELHITRNFGIEVWVFGNVDTFHYSQRFTTLTEAMQLSNEERDQRLRVGWTLAESADHS